jgi:hypothetical protein
VSDAGEDEGLPPPPLDEEERAYRASLEKLVDWVRVEQSRVLLRAFLPAALVLVPVGGVLVALSFARSEHGPLLLVLGLVLIASGPSWALVSLIRSMQRDAYVAIRVDGLAVRLDVRRDEAVYPWPNIADARPDPGGTHAVRVELTGEPPLVLTGPFSGVSEEELARRIRDARRLAVWNRLSARSR